MAVTCMHVVHMICSQSIKRNVCELREQLFVASCIVCYIKATQEDEMMVLAVLVYIQNIMNNIM